MHYDPTIWSKLHGAATHFPIALMLVSAFCDLLSLFVSEHTPQGGLRSTATLTIALGALGSYAAVASGVVLTRGQLWGHGSILRHHQFVWPAFALMSGLATWRIVRWRQATLRPSNLYLALMLLAAALMTGAGYWGGEVLNHG